MGPKKFSSFPLNEKFSGFSGLSGLVPNYCTFLCTTQDRDSTFIVAVEEEEERAVAGSTHSEDSQLTEELYTVLPYHHTVQR